MGLVHKLNKFGIKALHVKPVNPNPCIVIGNAKEETLKDLNSFSYLSPFECENKNIDFFGKYEVGSEDGVLALILNFCALKSDEKLEAFLDELDIGYISAECNIGEEEIEELALHVKGKSGYLYICEDLEFHERVENIAKLLSMCEYYCGFSIIYEKLQNDINQNNLIIADEIEELKSFDGAVVYFVDGNEKLYGSKQFALSNRLQDKDEVLVKTKNHEFKREFVLKTNLKGTIGLLESEKKEDTYAYEVSKITRIVNG